MKLKTLIQAIGAEALSGDLETEVTSVVNDSRTVTPGSLFAAVRGQLEDGRRFVSQAVQAGASAVLVDAPLTEKPPVPVLMASDVRWAMTLAAAEVYGRPAERLVAVAVTGTKGKTTTTFLVRSILERAGLSAGLIGTVKASYDGIDLVTNNTTPEGPELQRLLLDMVERKVTHVVIEVSSHALVLSRVLGCAFDVGVFTNLGREHLDFHEDMPTYFEAKRRLFTELLIGRRLEGGPRAVINVDDEWGRKLAAEVGPKAVTFGLTSPADFTARPLKAERRTLSAELVTPDGTIEVHSKLVGRVNLYNLLAAAAAGRVLGRSLDEIKAGLEDVGGVPGRLERVGSSDDFLVLVDYAHTAESLAETLASVRDLAAGRLLVVFGCGGDRDRAKRPEMGKAAGRLADLAIVTSDNPRTEEPMAIIREIEAGLTSLGLSAWKPGPKAGRPPARSYAVAPDRRGAIWQAVYLMEPGDVLLVAGKGHEPYQILGREKVHFDDREEVRAALVLEGKA
jgi:UDP-N-acetylmuramoyl-L-alanyl-D-glutamate--2,6-diaminopimelate ligase